MEPDSDADSDFLVVALFKEFNTKEVTIHYKS